MTNSLYFISQSLVQVISEVHLREPPGLLGAIEPVSLIFRATRSSQLDEVTNEILSKVGDAYTNVVVAPY